MIFLVRTNGHMMVQGHELRCALGRSGVRPAAAKREGDGATPAGIWPIRRLLFRPDAGPAPRTRLAATPIQPNDGWCDDPGDVLYNQQVSLPHTASAETLWRSDRLYDRVVVLGYNDDPIIAGAGSAIFLHLAKPDYGATEGCVALADADMTTLLGLAAPGDAIRIDLPQATA